MNILGIISEIPFFNTYSILLLSLCIYIYYKLIRRDPRVVKHVSKIPGPRDWPIIGSSLEFIGPSEELVKRGVEAMQEFGKVWKIWFGNIPCVVIANGEYAEKLLSSNVHINKSFDYNIIEPWLRTGLLTSNGSKWHSRRKLLTPTFHFKILEEFIHVFNEQSDTLISVLEKESAKDQFFDIFPIISRCTLDIICETAMGTKIYAQKDPNSPYLQAVNGVCEVLIRRAITPWLRPNFLWKIFPEGRKEAKYLKVLHGFTQKVILERKVERRQNPIKLDVILNDEEDGIPKKKKLAFLDLLLDISEDNANNALSDLDIQEEVDTFMFEGFDTTAASLNWAIYCLATNPDCQRKVHEELDGIFGSNKNPWITTEDLSKMKYLHMCLKETLRIYPSVPFFTRGLFQDLDLGDGIIIPSGASLTVFTFALHRDPKVFPNPDVFDPERFNVENSKGRNPFCYVPFSAGPRGCIGQRFAVTEDKVILAKLFLNYRFEFEGGDVCPCPDIILRPRNGIRVKVFKRD